MSQLECLRLASHETCEKEKRNTADKLQAFTEAMNKKLEDTEKSWRHHLEETEHDAASAKATAIRGLEEKLVTYQTEASKVQSNLCTTICLLKKQLSEDREQMQNIHKEENEDKEKIIRKIKNAYETETTAQKMEIERMMEQISNL
eukprot:6572872-Ditylum_brightwellii.AAC.1